MGDCVLECNSPFIQSHSFAYTMKLTNLKVNLFATINITKYIVVVKVWTPQMCFNLALAQT